MVSVILPCILVNSPIIGTIGVFPVILIPFKFPITSIDNGFTPFVEDCTAVEALP